MQRLILRLFLATACAAGVTAALPGAADAQTARRAARAASAASGQSLGSVRVTRNVMADGKPLPAGTYQVRLTDERPQPATGASPDSERWVEFVQGGKVRGREVASVVPQGEIGQVAEGKPPASGSSRVDMLAGRQYVRVWINRGGNHYLIHLPTGEGGRTS